MNRKRRLSIAFITGVGLAVLVPILLIIVCYYLINPYKKYVVTADSSPPIRVGIVLGAGISRNGKPYDELKARLDSGAAALEQGVVETLILSGDNRFHDYNEPEAMKQYLLEKGISEDDLVLDYAGRSTYESCERAKKVFQLNQAIIFSAGSHLPRAIYLCRHFGIESYGIASGLEANNSGRREPLARVKAIYNAQLIGERTVLGDPIQVP